MIAAGISFTGTSQELKEKIDLLRAVGQYSDEAVILYFETDDAEYSIRKVEEMYQQYKEKVHPQTVQSLGNEQ